MSVAGQGVLFAWLQMVSCFKVPREVAVDHRDLMPVNVAHWLQMALQASLEHALAGTCFGYC